MAERITGTPDEPWSVERLGAELKSYIGRLGHLWVEGEITQWSNSRGNVFGKLKDVAGDSTVAFNVWSSTLSRIEGEFSQGDRVVALVKPDYWPRGGTLSMVTAQLRHVGIGDLLARLEALRRSLAAEGLFDAARKRPLPFLPGVVGLITGRDSDAEKDVLRNAQLRWPAVRFEIREVAVQGPEAPRQVAAALADLDADPAVDVIVIARGGGALEEVVLPFSDEALVRAVAAARTPVVSAIGHEADRPVLDDVADVRASTPTDAAKRIVPDAAQEAAGIAEARRRLAAAVERRVQREGEGLAQLRSRPVLADPVVMVDGREQDLHAWRERARRATAHRLTRERDAVEHLVARVRALSPQQTLDRGYAVVQQEGRLIRDAAQVAPGEDVDILVASGRISAEVTAVRPGRVGGVGTVQDEDEQAGTKEQA